MICPYLKFNVLYAGRTLCSSSGCSQNATFHSLHALLLFFDYTKWRTVVSHVAFL